MKKYVCVMVAIFTLFIIWPAKHYAEAAQSTETINPVVSVKLIDALKQGLISRISIEGGDKSITIVINTEKAANIGIPSGLTTFGFTSGGKIKTSGYALEIGLASNAI